MSTKIQIQLNEKFYLKNPEESEIGRRIVEHSVRLIDEIGFEHFTFKKLALEMGSTEATMYKYFQNKHKLLVYLISWYWAWLDYKINFETHNIKDPLEKLKIILIIISEAGSNDPNTNIDESKLHRIVIAEASKAYLTKEVDDNNKEGFYNDYKILCKKIATVITEISPQHPFPHSLVSTVIEAYHQQRFFALHLPSLSDVKKEDLQNQLLSFLKHMVFSSLEYNKKVRKTA